MNRILLLIIDKIYHINIMSINQNFSHGQGLNSFENKLNQNEQCSQLKEHLEREEYFKQQVPKISVIGVGGAGGNAANNMIREGLKVNFLAANTDAQALSMSMAKTKIQLGANLTKGFGAGGIPEIGKESAEESKTEILSHLSDSDMIFITAGMGGGTGTGAAPMIAQYLQEHREKTINEHGVQYGLTSLSIGVVTKPFNFEGPRKAALAAKGLEEMKKYVDTLIVVPNQNLFRIANEKTTFKESFARADEVLGNAIRCISGLITDAGLINVDFADVRSVLSKRGKAVIGIGCGTGDDRAIMAALDAMSNPILDQVSFKKAKALLVSVTGGDDLTLFEIDAALNRIRDEIDEDANIIFGSVYDESKTGSISVSVVATGIEDENTETKSEQEKLTKKKFYTFDEKTQTKNHEQLIHENELQNSQQHNNISNETLEINIDGQNVNLEIDEKLQKLGVYEEFKDNEKKKVGVLARLGFDIPAYLRRKKDKE
jgi:cell division protein FtsZ